MKRSKQQPEMDREWGYVHESQKGLTKEADKFMGENKKTLKRFGK